MYNNKIPLFLYHKVHAVTFIVLIANRRHQITSLMSYAAFIQSLWTNPFCGNFIFTTSKTFYYIPLLITFIEKLIQKFIVSPKTLNNFLYVEKNYILFYGHRKKKGILIFMYAPLLKLLKH